MQGTSIDVEATGAQGQLGDLNVGADLRWLGGASLTLGAVRNVSIASGTTVSNGGNGNLFLRADAGGIDNGGSVTNLGTLDWSNSAGTIVALYDMNGAYAPGTIMTNSAWVPAPFSGLLTQATGYKLVNNLTDLQDVSQGLAGNYALGKDIDASATSGGANPSAFTTIGAGQAQPMFTGQFDGMGHVIDGLATQGFATGGPASFQVSYGGLFAYLDRGAVVRNLRLTDSTASAPQVQNANYLGLLAGRNDGLIANVTTSGSARASGPSENVGGITGNNNGTIERSASSADVEGGGAVGGLAGINSGNVDQSYATGSVAGEQGYAGGLVGTSYAGTISQSYATGPASAANAGGLVGLNAGMAKIDQSFADGPVTSNGPVPAAGIAAVNYGGIGNNVYWNRDVVAYGGSGTSPSNGLSSAQMSDPASFDASWDFSPSGTWAMPAGATHPVLHWQAQQ